MKTLQHTRIFIVAVTVTFALKAFTAFADDATVDPAGIWNQQALATARAENASDAQAARLYAMVNVAMYDAVNGIVSRRSKRDRAHALVPATGAPDGDIHAAAVAAAHAVLIGEYPDRAAIYNAQKQRDLAALRSSPKVTAGNQWGAAVGAAVRAARANDGSTPNETRTSTSSEPGQFRGAWSGAQFRNLRPFGIVDPSIYVGSGPPALASLDYAAAVAEVKILGNAANPDAEKDETVQFWDLDAGTSQIPGAWIQIGLAVSHDRALTLEEKTRLFALMTMAMSDAVAPTFTAKYVFNHWDPTTAIREADADGNPHTHPDFAWLPRAASVGGSPEYFSGHSSFSSAAAAVLAGFFCADNIPFALVTDSAPRGQSRTYPSFSAAAAESGRSRMLGGIHFNFGHSDGLVAGKAVAREILATRLLLLNGPTHFGECPL